MVDISFLLPSKLVQEPVNVVLAYSYQLSAPSKMIDNSVAPLAHFLSAYVIDDKVLGRIRWFHTTRHFNIFKLVAEDIIVALVYASFLFHHSTDLMKNVASF